MRIVIRRNAQANYKVIRLPVGLSVRVFSPAYYTHKTPTVEKYRRCGMEVPFPIGIQLNSPTRNCVGAIDVAVARLSQGASSRSLSARAHLRLCCADIDASATQES